MIHTEGSDIFVVPIMFFLQRLSTPATSILNRGSIQLSATCSGNRWFSEEVQQKRKKKKKRKVDPNAPKRPLTAYTLFVKDSFPRLKGMSIWI